MTIVASLAGCILLVNLCWAAPTPDTNDVLSGQDFLAVFMRSSPRTRSVPPSSSYYINRNLIKHNNKDGSAVDYELVDRDDHDRLINEENVISRKSGITITKSTHIEGQDNEQNFEQQPAEQTEEVVGVQNQQEDEEQQTKQEPAEEDENASTSSTVENDLVTTDMSLTTTTEQPVGETDTELPSQVVSVRVSSSVVRQRPRLEEKPGIATTQDEPGLTAAAVQRSHFGVEESTGAVMYKVTSEEPEERVSYSQEATVLRIEGRQSSSRRPLLTHHQLHHHHQQQQQDSFAEASQQYASSTVMQPQPQQQQPQPQQQQTQQDLADLENQQYDLIQTVKIAQTVHKVSSPAPPLRNTEIRSPRPVHQTVIPNYSQAQALTYHPLDLEAHPGSAPVTYETSVTSATSGSRVQFYSEPPGYRIQAADKRKDRRFDLNQYQEKVYGQPEKNYEVDEAVSVLTNGRTHGVQQQQQQHAAQERHHHHHHHHHQQQQQQPQLQQPNTAGVSTVQTPEAPHTVVIGGKASVGSDIGGIPSINVGKDGRSQSGQSGNDDDEENKFGYVVEDRNYRKYRVEEKTPDGFIVGEYGVVSHDDGSLRGVRYTADSTINPRLIYDALVKFLSLK